MKKIKIDQKVFLLQYLEDAATGQYFLFDGAHPKGAKTDKVPINVGDAAWQAFIAGTHTLTNDSTEKDIFGNIPAATSVTKDTITYLDVTGFPGANSGAPGASAAREKKAFEYLEIKVKATGTDGISVENSFWMLHAAVSVNGKWVQKYRQINGGPLIDASK
ncbi:MAG: hypothetical protein WCL32_13050 [Planctomycetota bacterium]